MPQCSACRTENPEIARFCLACGTPFARTCASCGTANPDDAKFCLGCGTLLTPTAAPAAAALPPEPEVRAPAEERRPITAVFVDIVGSTSRAEQLDPEDVLALLEPYYMELRNVLEGHGGVVEKFIGDAVVALFGAPVAHEDDPERAVRAGLGILTAITALNEEDPTRELRVRVGITTGEAIVSLDARVDEGRGMAWGDVLNTAARLQSAAPVNGVLVDGRTYRACASAILFEEAEPVVAKGKVEPVSVWTAVGVRDGATRAGAVRSPLVGRDDELALLDGLRLRVVESRLPALAVVVAEPGLGKSRLLGEIASRADDARVHWGRCLSYGEGITYWPVSEILRDAAGILTSDDGDTVATKLDALLGELPTGDPDQLRTIAAALSHLVGARTTPRGSYSTAEISQAEVHWGIRRALELLAELSPVVLVFEDLHWAEPALVELIESLLDGDGPILVLASARPEIASAHPVLLEGGDRRVVLDLESLTSEQSEQLVSTLLAVLVERGLDTTTLERLVRNARGNPLFLEETAQMLLDSGVVDSAAVEALPIPDNVQALVASRLDALPAPERRLAQHASVAGSIFWSGAAARLDGTPAADPLLEALERRSFVNEHEQTTIEAEREWEFRHVVIREVAYGRLPKGRRVGLHVRFADWISELPGSDEEFVEILAYHLEHACKLGREVGRTDVPPPIDRAVAALARAGEKAERREGVREAHRFYTRALQLIDEADEGGRLDLRLRRAGTLIALGELNASTDELIDITAQSRRLLRPEILCEALTRLGNVDMKQGRAGDARAHLEEAARVASELGDDRLRIRAAFELSALKGDFEGTIDAALADLDEGIALATANDDLALRTEGHLRLGMLLLNVGRLREADEHLTRCASLAGEFGSLKDDARATAMLALVKHYRGADDEAELLARQAYEWFERTADSYFQIQNLRLLAMLALERGDRLAEAELHVGEALSLARDGGGWLLYETYRLQARVLVVGGRLDEARTLLAEVAVGLPAEDPYVRAAVRLMEATVASAAREREIALDAYRDAIGLLAEQQLQIDLGEAQIAYARALREFGDHELARSELAVARETFAAMGAQGLVTVIDRELDLISTVASGG